MNHCTAHDGFFGRKGYSPLWHCPNCKARFEQATLAKPLPAFTVLLPCFFPVCLAGTPQIPRGATKKGLNNGTASNRDSLSGGNFLSEIGSALAARMLDWTGGAYLSS
jgi:hypothetical protein